jgi:uncharacterized protein
MNGMKFPIDIMWLNGNGTIVHIESNVQPCISSCQLYTPDTDALFVLETTAGFSKRHDIKLGTKVNFNQLAHYP